MKINNNIQALNAYRNLNANQFQTSKNLEKLSSGLRINRAADDAAGLAISEKMRSQIRGLKQAERNSMDGISLMQTAEGALQEVHAMLQRMRELTVQGANDTNTEYDREQIQKEIDQLKLEIDSVSEKTEFNTRTLLNGSSAVLTTFKDANTTNTANLTEFPMVMNPALKSGDYRLDITGTGATPTVVEEVVRITQPAAGIGEAADVVFDDPSEANALGEYTINIRNFNDGGASIEVIGPNGIPIDKKAVAVGGTSPKQVIGGLEIDVSKITGAGTVKVSMEMKAEFSVFYKEDDPSASYEKGEFDKEITTRNGVIRHGGLEFKFDSSIKVSDATNKTEFALINNALAFQIGPNTNQNVMIDIPQLDTVRLGIEKIDVTTQVGANEAIFTLDKAINILSDVRAKLGATQNRMEHTINNLQVTHENLTASESRIRDADMALEMTEFTRNNILNQSATAMLAQANQLPQGVLQLLQ
ncbi:flagellin N-terminal helical domain-containing protein [Alkalihalobacillus deserti]|uniref:flagellin N-terminal helical domain-containing protein n=1 Tax=Alkalihalobacillus deserti TaxID=2879466 RepID=UPI001D14DEFE|nr:flagellin [Alkalihalobacillus deserti]